MKKLGIGSIILLIATGLSHAGVISTGGGKVTTTPVPPSSCDDCWAPGTLSMGTYAAAIFTDGGHLDDGYGGGISLNYSICENFAVEVDATWLDNDNAIHAFSASAVLRKPMGCLAPYVMAGGGVHTNSTTQGIWHAGGGIDYRLSSCVGAFVDGRYTWAEETDGYTLVRAGVKFNF